MVFSKLRSLAALACLSMLAIAAWGAVVIGGAIVSLLAWPATAIGFRADSTPRSIFESRRAGLA